MTCNPRPSTYIAAASVTPSDCQKDTVDDVFESKVLCYGCSIACHGSHEIVELYHKRGFRCDCREKYRNCVLLAKEKNDSGDLHPSNYYGGKASQNFQGLFCVCHEPYIEDPEEAQEEATIELTEVSREFPETTKKPSKDSCKSNVMFQCVVCEDWFHETCIGIVIV